MIGVRHLLVVLDGSAGDRRALDAATATALGTGGGVTLLLPRTARVARRLSGFAESEGLAPPDAGEQYVARAALMLQDWGVDARAESLPSIDPAHDIASYSSRHGITTVLVVQDGTRRAAVGRGVAQQLLRLSPVPVLVLPAAGGDTAPRAA